ncbi:acetyl-CoA C-acyltransferase family protein [Nitrospirillum amazonense]|uniref:acetyl-CoA C-acyltransferase family protein n=1 Tax=Nitrospirillum amazonense TaxID=28077 RepID=UPI0024127BBF|nr:acetyl-CoA C-acyltransferase family protein [Nitrospirillum amazonense]MDG3444102.1 acetyl-CoA C-acyltransferase family protein [Nitrospirillum amazonense]
MTEVFIVSGVRTAIGDFGGALKDIAPGELATKVTRAALDRAGVANDAVGHVVFGQVIPTEPRDAYLARVAGIGAGLPVEVPALTVNRLCGSGLQAVVSAAQSILLGDCDVAVAGGAENMSRAPYLLPDARWGSKMGDARVVDYLNGALSDPFDRNLMGVTAERVAQRYGISRDDQDALALESHRRAARAQAEGRFTEQILPVEVTVKRQTVQFATDEHVRPDLAPGDLAKLRTVFQKDGTVTAGNASGINDGAAAVVLASGEAVKRLGLTPLARLVGYAHAGVDPAYMGIGPIPATRKLLARTGLTVQDLTVIESNEAFAAQACAVARELDFDPDRVNPNGSGISLGHPVGATGAINLVKALYELRRVSGRRALVTMCIGGGQGIAAVIEAV